MPAVMGALSSLSSIVNVPMLVATTALRLPDGGGLLLGLLGVCVKIAYAPRLERAMRSARAMAGQGLTLR